LRGFSAIAEHSEQPTLLVQLQVLDFDIIIIIIIIIITFENRTETIRIYMLKGLCPATSVWPHHVTDVPGCERSELQGTKPQTCVDVAVAYRL